MSNRFQAAVLCVCLFAGPFAARDARSEPPPPSADAATTVAPVRTTAEPALPPVASTPAAPASTAAATAAPIAPAASESTAPAADPAPPIDAADTEPDKVPAGYKSIEKNGVTYYCHKQIAFGTRVAQQVCMTVAEYKASRGHQQSSRQAVTNREKSYEVIK